MFYPIDSLRRGGRFYLCWVADSWPLRFASIGQKQLWSHDVRKICDDLLQVVTRESGRPIKRFSLRLSSQLLHGLVIIYQRKVNILMVDLVMINATVNKNINKKYTIHDVVSTERNPQLQAFVPQEVLPEEEPRVEELFEKSGNVVSNIQDITLKEATIPEHQPPVDDFGEENQEEALMLMLKNRTLEVMLQQSGTSVGQTSALDLAVDVTDKSHDRTRLNLPQLTMERISDYDVSGLGQVTLTPGKLIDKDFPEISELPPPEVSAPQFEVQDNEVETALLAPEVPQVIEKEQPKKSEEIQLEEIEEYQPPRKRRRPTKLIIDKKIKLTSNFLRSRIENVALELRCEDSTNDIIEIRLPWLEYARRPCHAGSKLHSNFSVALTRLYQRNIYTTKPFADSDRQEAMAAPGRDIERQTLQTVVEEIQPVEKETPMLEIPVNTSKEIIPDMTMPRVSHIQHEEVDISNMLTQKLETYSQKQNGTEDVVTPKRRRYMGWQSFQNSRKSLPQIIVENLDADKENIPENMNGTSESRHIMEILQQSGLAEVRGQPSVDKGVTETRSGRKRSSRDSETPLGSLDRTKVSLGDEPPTETSKLIREHWGIEGTATKILKCLRSGCSPIRLENIMERGPVVAGKANIIAALCFTSILKLKNKGFIIVEKDPTTLEIEDIKLGPAILGLQYL